MKKVWALTRADWLNLWRTSKIFFGMILLYEVVYILAGEEWMFLSILSVALGGMLSYSAIGYDERSGWNRFVLTTAYSRKDYVLGKYLVAVTGTLGGALLMAATGAVAAVAGRVPLGEGMAPLSGMMACGVLIALSIVLPLAFRFGMEKARLMNILVIAILCGGAGVMAGLGGDLIGNIPQVMTVLNLALPAVTAAVLAGSCFLSVRIYRRRQF